LQRKQAPASGCSALSLACKHVWVECKVTMVKVSYHQSRPASMMRVWGGEVVASPSQDTQAGRDVLAKYPNSNGSLGVPSAKPLKMLQSAMIPTMRLAVC